MSRKRSRAEVSGGPEPLSEQAPLYARNPRGLFRPAKARGEWRPAWETPSFRIAVIVLIAAPIVLMACIMVVAAVMAVMSH